MGLFSSLLGNAGTVNPEQLANDYADLLIENEEVDIGFKLVRDTLIFTNKRLIFVNIQGLTGKKREYLSIAYRSISRFSIETAGTFDLEAELKIYISSESTPSITQNFNKKVNVYDVQKVLAQYVL
ncbi:PH domain-containing protein [Psychroflexus salarius]|uniref:PH domain-containing protein n=1 Tax=Psychroflexus salarius TaxID=1155689 RepID=A0A1M4SCI3_9FLAO|nr:PH domain-containing protein [Psychroflexus salarius]SHE29892.1 PH domain-containing protein [Psychroflexus salarius]